MLNTLAYRYVEILVIPSIEGIDIDRLRREREKKEQELARVGKDGTKKPAGDAKKIAEKQPKETVARPQNEFVDSIANAPRSAKIVGIFVIAIVALALIGYPRTEPPPIPEQPPSLSVSPDPISINIGNISTGNTEVRNISISNSGQGILKWNVSIDQPWMAVPGNGIGSGTVNISINTTGLQLGRQTGTITINSNAGTKYGKISLDVLPPTPTSTPTPTPTPTPTSTPTSTPTPTPTSTPTPTPTSTPTPQTPTPPVLKTINVSPPTAYLEFYGSTAKVGRSASFISDARDQYGNPMTVTVTWSSSNTNVGTIDSNGLFTAKAEGVTLITATSGAISGTATVIACDNSGFVPCSRRSVGSALVI